MLLVLFAIQGSGTPVWVTGIGKTDVAIGVLDVSWFLELAGKQGTKGLGVVAIDGLHKLLLGECAIAVRQQGKELLTMLLQFQTSVLNSNFLSQVRLFHH